MIHFFGIVISGALLTQYYSYVEYMRTYRLSKQRDFFWCRQPACGSGQVHLSGVSSPRMTCDRCKKDTCVICDIPYHDFSSCEQARELDKVLPTANLQDGMESAKLISAITKNCPRCKVPILKDEGCNEMNCELATSLWFRKLTWLCFRQVLWEAFLLGSSQEVEIIQCGKTETQTLN